MLATTVLATTVHGGRVANSLSGAHLESCRATKGLVAAYVPFGMVRALRVVVFFLALGGLVLGAQRLPAHAAHADAPNRTAKAVVAHAAGASRNDQRFLCQDNCGAIRDNDVRFLCQGNCGAIRDNDARFFCQGNCGAIRHNDHRFLCQGNCGAIRDNDARFFCQGNCGAIRDNGLRFACQHNCGAI